MFRYDGESTRPMMGARSGRLRDLPGHLFEDAVPGRASRRGGVAQALFGSEQAAERLRAEISERKSFVTVNTSQVTQALVGGVLLREGHSLRRLVDAPRRFYHDNRDVLLGALERAFGTDGEIRWNRPDGGFFLGVTLPFEFGERETVECARDHGVIVMPMTFFSLDASRRREVRLAFSNAGAAEIEAGVARFASYLGEKRASLA